MSFFVYILRCRDGSLYTGMTGNLENRMKQHANGKGSKYVRSRRPFRLVYKEELKDRPGALKRENEIKQMNRPSKMMLLNR